ncbi:MAG: hypothetical protein FWC53_04170 [Firmicutes bacterium]|nr:hypothetical protein [Bacillota bacterium]
MKGNRGITIVALIITIVLMLILAGVIITIGSNVINRSQFEDIKTNMLTIQGKALTIGEKNSFDPANNPLLGTQIDKQAYTANGYTLPNELINALKSKDSDAAAVYYIWGSTELNNQGLTAISLGSNAFYVVDYNSNDVFYSAGAGVDGQKYYSLADIKDK